MNISVPGMIILKLISRHLISGLGVFLVSHKLLDPDEVPAYAQDAAGVAVFLAGLAWSYRSAVLTELRVMAAAITGHFNPDVKDPIIKAQATAAIAAKSAAVLLIVSSLGLSGCASQVGAIQAALTPYETAIQNACADVLPLAEATPDALALSIKAVGAVKYGVIGGCATLDGIIAMAKSATTQQWLDTAKTVLQSKGAILPAPVAPVAAASSPGV
jgi:hypothetical protein